MMILRFLFLLFFLTHDAFMATAFTGTYGINYGRIANNIPPPDEVVRFLKAAKIKNVRIYDADHSVLNAFKGSGLELVIGLPNEYVKDMSANADHALNWTRDNVKAFLPETRIVGIAIGNEVLGGSDYDLGVALLGAVKNIYNSTKKLGIDDVVQITTAHSQAVFTNSFPPSSCIFKEGVAQLMKPLLEFFSGIGSPFCLNAYPFLSYTYNPGQIDINYALFQPTEGINDEKTDLHYDNLLDAQIDAAYAALEKAGFKKMEVIITETGWASHGDQNEPAATPANARMYHYNLRKRLAKRKGSPMRPKSVLKAYIFALFNENSKPGAGSEKYYGLFKADGSVSYDIGFRGLKSSSATSSHLSIKAGFRQLQLNGPTSTGDRRPNLYKSAPAPVPISHSPSPTLAPGAWPSPSPGSTATPPSPASAKTPGLPPSPSSASGNNTTPPSPSIAGMATMISPLVVLALMVVGLMI